MRLALTSTKIIWVPLDDENLGPLESCSRALPVNHPLARLTTSKHKVSQASAPRGARDERGLHWSLHVLPASPKKSPCSKARDPRKAKLHHLTLFFRRPDGSLFFQIQKLSLFGVRSDLLSSSLRARARSVLLSLKLAVNCFRDRGEPGVGKLLFAKCTFRPLAGAFL